ncbi:MAG: hypothetical protein DMG03_21315 [Acidobacteria bacterium]|nr:MAG: hypothetical protein DMG03_21315 [Acidobacteriota bacterium]
MPPDSPSPADIEALIQRCLRGDQLAWDAIVKQYWRKVFNVAYKFVGKHDEAEDLAQDIFLKIFKSLDTFDRRANFQTWLISISRNLCIDHYRSVRKERETIDRDVDASELSPRSKTQGQMAMMEQRDRVQLLKDAMSALPKTLRTAVLMRDIQELSYHEIAEKLKLPEGTVKSRINRGRNELARQIRKLRGEDFSPTGTSRRRVGRARRRVAPDVPHPRRFRGGGHRSALDRQARNPDRSVAGDLRRQRHDRLSDGSVSADDERRRPSEAVGRAETRRDDADDDRGPELHRDTR